MCTPSSAGRDRTPREGPPLLRRPHALGPQAQSLWYSLRAAEALGDTTGRRSQLGPLPHQLLGAGLRRPTGLPSEASTCSPVGMAELLLKEGMTQGSPGTQLVTPDNSELQHPHGHKPCLEWLPAHGVPATVHPAQASPEMRLGLLAHCQLLPSTQPASLSVPASILGKLSWTCKCLPGDGPLSKRGGQVCASPGPCHPAPRARELNPVAERDFPQAPGSAGPKEHGPGPR